MRVYGGHGGFYGSAGGKLRCLFDRGVGEGLYGGFELGIGVGGKLEGGFGVGGLLEDCRGWTSGFSDEEFGGCQGAEGVGEGEVLVEEEADGGEARTGVLGYALLEVAFGVLEDQGVQFGVVGAELDGERGSDARAKDEDAVGRDVAGCSEVAEGGGGVGLHEGLGGVLAAGEADAAVVEEEDVGVDLVEDARGWEGVGDGAVAGVEDEGGWG